jgi:hypothetical protein
MGLPRPVEVLHGGRWMSGELLATRRGPQGWRGLVAYTDRRTALGYYHWREQAELRRPVVASPGAASPPR